MTNWLKWRLCALFTTSLIIGGTTYLRAQNDYQAPAKSPEEAAMNFYNLVEKTKTVETSPPNTFEEVENSPFFSSHPQRFLGSVSRVQIQSFQKDELGQALYQLLSSMAQPPIPQFDAHVTGTEGEQTIVEVGSAAHPKSQQVVVIAEDGGYRVDLKATFAQWNGLKGEQLEEEWFRYTGTISPALAKSGTFLKSQCQSQMKQQMLGMLQYAQDYDEKLPPARKWIDVLQPYVKSEPIFKCLAMPKGGNGYAYNQHLSQVSQAVIADMSLTVNVYETSNPRRNWFGPGTGRAYRHMDGLNVAFADGHVKWFKHGSSTGQYTFLPHSR